MIAFSNNMKVMIGISHIDFRVGINRLAAVAQSIFDRDPNDGVVFVFRNRRKTDIKLIFYDGNGFFLISGCQKANLAGGQETNMKV